MKQSFTVHDLPTAERPRERLFTLGAEALSVPEILALIMGRGVRGESVLLTAQNLIQRFGSLEGIAAASVEQLSTVKGIGPAKAAQLKAAIELGRRLDASPPAAAKARVRNPEDLSAYMMKRMRGKKREHFCVVLLDTRNQVIGQSEVSIGSLNASIVHPREVFKAAMSASAASVILVHNHPSGDPNPSQEDIDLTRRLVEVGELVGIPVLDHIIICDSEHVSLKSRRLM